MGWAIHLQSFEKKEISRFKRSIVWDIFGSKARRTPEGWGLMYGDRNGGVLRLDDDDLIDGCSIRRPSEDSIRDLYHVAQHVRSAINVDASFFVADAAFLADIPEWLTSALPKPPRVVLSADELLERVAES
jgi:hypothetical protein